MTHTEHESYKTAEKRYLEASGLLFTAPSKKRSTFKRGAWLLCDGAGELVAIVNHESVIFGANLRGYMLQASGNAIEGIANGAKVAAKAFATAIAPRNRG